MRLELLALACLMAPLTVNGLTAQEEEQATGPQVGKPAPTLRLNDHTGKAVQLGGESGTWTVLAFYPKAGTAG